MTNVEHHDEPMATLDAGERREVRQRRSGSSRIIHEVIRIEGEEELVRPAKSLILSGGLAGVAITASVFAKAELRAGLPDAPWRHLIESLGYSAGFIIVVMARLQLFTENTVTAVLPVTTHPSWAKLGQMLRLWGIVFLSNIAGTLAIAWLVSREVMISPETFHAILAISRELFAASFWQSFWLGVPAGFLIGSLCWIQPNARGSEFWVILALGYLISVGNLTHAIAGAAEVWTVWLAGESSLSHAVFGVLLPTLLGNIVGGTGLFAVLAHGQVSDELAQQSSAAE